MLELTLRLTGMNSSNDLQSASVAVMNQPKVLNVVPKPSAAGLSVLLNSSALFGGSKNSTSKDAVNDAIDHVKAVIHAVVKGAEVTVVPVLHTEIVHQHSTKISCCLLS